MLASLLLTLPAAAQEDGFPGSKLSPLVTRLLDDDLLSDADRRSAMIFHGQWDELEALNRSNQIVLNAARYQISPKQLETLDKLLNPGEGEPDEPNHDEALFAYAQNLVNAGKVNIALPIIDNVTHEFDAPWLMLHAKACESSGDYQSASQSLEWIRRRVQEEPEVFTTAAELTAAAQAVIMLARLEGRPAADFHLANKLLAKARDEVDPLYWPAYVAEAELLWSKGNPSQAMDAAVQALSLNPKSSEAWYLFGSMRSRFFDFDSAERAVKKLREINDSHPLGKALAVQIALRQKDVTKALTIIEPALEAYPNHRKLLALNAAVQARNFDTAKKDAALAQFVKLAPGNPLAVSEIGQSLNDARQYALAEPYLKQAIQLMPGWSKPQLTLGQLYMDWGKLEEAAAQLQAASSLDPFHKEITNQLLMVNEMLGYATLQNEQFLVRYKPGIDEVLARDVMLHMGKMVDQFIERFKHDPPRLTQVDLMPDDEHFAVRLTGMPDIWTIAACTGDVIAMTPPRPGPKRAYGAYNWLNVMGHEYAHVVNLSQTDNRVPHWFTEGCAVQMETTGRLWSQYGLLADCYNNDKLFEYDEINWGFIRPTEDYHRSLAYAQSAWIMQYIEEEYGWDKALRMLELYKQGVGEHEVLKQVFTLEPDAFMDKFLAWAGKQIEMWGMTTYGVKPEDDSLALLLTLKGSQDADIATLQAAAEKHPDRPELLKYLTEKVLVAEDSELAIEIIKKFQKVRPVDPWADRQLARLALKSGETDTAMAALRTLDKVEGDAPEYAVELARVYRSRKDYEQALHFAERALLREPYNATYRESAATIAVQHGDLARAAFHVESLELQEPDRGIHPRRLAVIYERLGRKDDADAARKRAESLELSKD